MYSPTDAEELKEWNKKKYFVSKGQPDEEVFTQCLASGDLSLFIPYQKPVRLGTREAMNMNMHLSQHGEPAGDADE